MHACTLAFSFNEASSVHGGVIASCKDAATCAGAAWWAHLVGGGEVDQGAVVLWESWDGACESVVVQVHLHHLRQLCGAHILRRTPCRLGALVAQCRIGVAVLISLCMLPSAQII